MHRSIVVGVIAVAAALSIAAPAHAESSTYTGTIDSCPGFDVVGTLTTRSTVSEGTVHLHLTGTVANAVSGRSGRYAEIQVDRARPDGSTSSSGLLGKLTVPGRGTALVYAGRVAVAPDGTVAMTPHVAGVDDLAGFHDALCAALG